MRKQVGIGCLVLAISVAATLLQTVPAHASSTWDADDPGRRLDIRWVGVYVNDDGILRVTITFYEPIRNRWLDQDPTWPELSTVYVGLSEPSEPREFHIYAMFHLGRRHPERVTSSLGYGGSGLGETLRVRRPNATTLRAWYQPDWPPDFAGWRFRGVTTTRGPWPRAVLDRTRWGAVQG